MSLTFTEAEVPVRTLAPRPPHPLRAPVAEAVARLTVGGASLVTTCKDEESGKVVRFAREAGRDLGVTIRAVVEEAGKGKSRVTLWAVPLQKRPGAGKRAAAE